MVHPAEFNLNETCQSQAPTTVTRFSFANVNLLSITDPVDTLTCSSMLVLKYITAAARLVYQLYLYLSGNDHAVGLNKWHKRVYGWYTR